MSDRVWKNLLLCLVLTGVCLARPDGLREYRLVRAIDGDTIVVSRVKNEEIQLRLLGIDCLETRRTERLRKQAEELGLEVEMAHRYGEEASKYVEQKLRDRPLYVEWETRSKDKYRRKLGYVWIGDQEDQLLNLILLEEGLAKLYEGKASSHLYEEKFRQAQEGARAAQVGIWATPNVATEPNLPDPRKTRTAAPSIPWQLILSGAGLVLFVIGWRMK